MRLPALLVSIVSMTVLLFPAGGAAQVVPTCGGPIEPGRSITDVVSQWAPCDYSFEGEEGDVVTVAVAAESPGFDPRVWLLDPSGEEEAFDDDGGGDGDSLIAEHALRETGTYVIRVVSYGVRNGRFKVSLAIAEAEPEAEAEESSPDTRGPPITTGPPRCLGGAVQSGQPVNQKLSGKYCEFTFEGDRGKLVDIAVTSHEPGLDPNVSLLDPGLEMVAFDDDGGGDGNSLIQGHELLATGQYVIRVASYEERNGAIELVLVIRNP